MAMGPALWGQETILLRSDFSAVPSDSPHLELTGDATVENGVLGSISLVNWARSGVRVGPVPVSDDGLTIQYDVRPVRFGRQCQEFSSEAPRTHHYMVFVSTDGRLRCYTRLNDEWKCRAISKNPCKLGAWHRVAVVLTRKSIAYRISDRDSNTLIWDSGPIAMDDVGEETVFALIDEAPEAGEGASQWDNLCIRTSSAALAALWAEKHEQLLAERRERERRAAQVSAMRSRGLALIPVPQEMRFGEGAFELGDAPKICADARAGSKEIAIVRDVLAERLGVKAVDGKGGIVVASPSDADNALWRRPQSYRLIVRPGEIRIEAKSAAGFFYAAQTLAQLARSGRAVPAVEIEDWPGIPNRLVMVATSQGAFEVIDVEYWKRMIRELAAAKINAIMPYFEGGTFYYEKYPFLGRRGRNGFTVQKGKILSEYARKHFVEIMPQQQTLGHSGKTLGHEQTKHLREAGGTFCSSKPEVFEFLGDLFDELVQAFPHARYIHVGGDEFHHGFAKCPLCKARAEKIGLDGLYAEHMMKVRQLLADRKRGMMIWWHEKGFTESAHDKLAKDIVVFDWHYGNQRAYPSLDNLLSLGFSQTWATPAITRYYRKHCNDWHDTFGNLQGFMKAGLQRDVPGECTCTWVHGIWGGRNLFELNYYGLVFSGECAWNPMAASEDDFKCKFALHWFGLQGEDMEQEVHQAIHAPYGERKEQKFWRDCRGLEPILGEPPKSTAKLIGENSALVDEAKELIRLCDRADKVLNQWQASATRNKTTVDFLKHDVHMHRAAANRLLAIDAALRWLKKGTAGKGTPAPAEVTKPFEDLLRDYDQL